MVGQPLPLKNVIEPFPHTPHRPVITPHNLFYSFPSKPVLHWNCRKANWNLFSKLTKEGIAHLPPLQNRDVSAVYKAFYRMLLNTAKRAVPRGRRSHYTPCWDDQCQNLLEKYQKAAISDQSTIANFLCSYINEKRRKRWKDSVEQIDFTHSSRKAWSLFNHLTGKVKSLDLCQSLQMLSLADWLKLADIKSRIVNITSLCVGRYTNSQLVHIVMSTYAKK